MAFASTKSLNLREQRESDVDRIFNVLNDPSVQRTGPSYVAPKGSKLKKGISEWPDKLLLCVIAEAKEPLEQDDLSSTKAEGEDEKERQKRREDALFVGFVNLDMTLNKNRDALFAIALDGRWRGRGLGTEFVRWVVDYAFENLGLHRVTLGVLDGNIPAIKLYESVGFVHEGRQRKHNWQDGKWNDMLSMGILEEEWREAREKQGASSSQTHHVS